MGAGQGEVSSGNASRRAWWCLLAAASGCAPAESPPVQPQPDAGFDLDAGNPDASPFEGCATATAEGKLSPLGIYVMLDESGSMKGARWQAVTAAFESFVTNPLVADLGMGLQYFPLDGPQVCDFAGYAVPAVPMQPLSENASLVVDSLSAQAPVGETPTLPALQGALGYAKSFRQEHPEHLVVVVLATDGAPNACGSTVEKVAQAAQVGFGTEPSIRTFVVGVGDDLGSLDLIAASGGTDAAYLVDASGAETEAQLIDTLNAIRGALPCEYAIPKPAQGEIDSARVNVLYTPGDGTKPVVFEAVPDAAACATTASNWYYDDSEAPTKIILCEAACALIQQDPAARIDIVFGCLTELR
jgi:uncharacterized protein YegL